MSLDVFRLDGRVALVTGGSQGLGYVMAEALAGAGAEVIVTSRQRDRADAAAAELGKAVGRTVHGAPVDVTDAAQVATLIDSVVEEHGRIDVLINNAGVNIRKPIEEFDEASWDLVQDTNLKGPYLCARAIAPHLKRQRSGRVINVASMLGQSALPDRSAYCSAKAGLIQLTKVLALEWAPYNVTVNALCPGPFATDLNTPVINNPETNKFFVDQIALSRWGDPKELAGAAIFLASDASSFMTGAELVIDGGWTAH